MPTHEVPLAERVLMVVDLIPTGTVVTYGDIAELVGTSPRRIGTLMATGGCLVPWWRVVNVQGECGPATAEAHAHWAAEGIALRTNGRGCQVSRHRADLTELAARYDEALAEALATDQRFE